MRRVSKIIQLEIWFTEVGRNLGRKYLEPADRFRPKTAIGCLSTNDCYPVKAIVGNFYGGVDRTLVKIASDRSHVGEWNLSDPHLVLLTITGFARRTA